ENNWLALWNNTCEQQGLHGALGTGSSAYQWRPVGDEVDMSNAYSWNVTIPDLPGSSSASITEVLPGDLILGTSSSFGRLGTVDPYTLWAISDRDDGTRGELLWIQDYPAPDGDVSRTTTRGMHIDTVNRVFVMNDLETFEWWGYSIDTGDLVWGPVVATKNAFSYYGGGYGAGQIGTMAYGNIYIQSYGGEIACINCADGTVEWVYDETNSGIETPWGNYPSFIAAIADGKVYVFNNEHSPNYPLYKGEAMRCVDAYTGDEIWKLTSWVGQSGGGGVSTSALADGFFVYYNYYDNQIYCVGKGPSQTTVSTPDIGVSLGSSVLISGSVIDTASGTEQTEQVGRFPNGVPTVSDDSMTGWMEYVYMQKPMPIDVEGVTVILTAMDPNGNTQDIGTTTTDINGNFGVSWIPPVEGDYQVTAYFAGSDSYWPSYDTGYIVVDPATSTSTPIEPEEPETPDTETPDTETPDTETPDTEQPTAETALISTEAAIIAAVAVAAVIGVAAFWTLRKRK
ncbi:MAG: PQQ-binding-like beta-propeller repeat protein, partial [Candidatus Bathyarchaeota archaeon]|nr:PQQ-binding-like beta-propeller repeat protein [Candidatus Bathyarchaeum sp.]